jgi:hypothetical protein
VYFIVFLSFGEFRRFQSTLGRRPSPSGVDFFDVDGALGASAGGVDGASKLGLVVEFGDQYFRDPVIVDIKQIWGRDCTLRVPQALLGLQRDQQPHFKTVLRLSVDVVATPPLMARIAFSGSANAV